MQQPPQGYPTGSPAPPPQGYPSPCAGAPPANTYLGTDPGSTYSAPLPQGNYGYAAPAPGAPAHTTAAVAPSVVVAGSQYCFPHQVVFKLTEKVGWSGDSMDILDGTGTLRYKLKGKAISLKDKRTLLDPAGTPIITLKQKLLSLHGTWCMYKGATDTQLAEVKPNLIQLKPGIKIYLNDGDKEADFSIKGELLARKFEIYKREGETNAVIASVKKESKFAGAAAFCQSVVLEKQSYFLTVEPGVDTAFVVALATLLDEMFHDDH